MIATTDAELRQLLPQHHDLVLNSGVADKVAIARGYRSETVRANLKRLGFSDAQARVPALLIPLFGVGGDLVGYQLRPDAPRIKQGKPVKYETPSGSRMVLDVHPFIRDRLADPAAPLWITEGVRKGDSGVSIGLCCIALLGVWNWRGTNDQGGKTALADFEAIALNGRDVFVAFDSDVMLKPAVHGALARLGAFLASRGAHVRYVYLPSRPGGSKVGLDDYLVAGHGVDDLLALASSDLRQPPTDGTDEVATPYAATDAGMVWRKPVQGGTIDIPLANFTARIVADVVEDDGAETRRAFELEATLRGQTLPVTVPAAQFAGMSWVGDHLGAGAMVWPGMGLKDHLRFAIQLMSGEIPTRHVYAHTGWRLVNGQWLYLHANGAIGATGAATDVEVALSGPLGRVALPDPPHGTLLVDAVRAALELFHLLPVEVAVPLLSAVFLAPLRELLGADAPDFVPWLHGPSGTFKSELLALGQAFYGDFTRQSLPANFAATANAIERLAFAAKDALLAVDDYHPAGDQREQQAMNQVANRLLRGAGNGSGRARMRADTTFRAALTPRGLTLASGERLPEGHSTAARMFPVAVQPGGIDPSRLTQAQARRHAFPLVLAAYIQEIATRFDALRQELPTRFRTLRHEVQTGGAHRREPGQIAHLLLGLEAFLELAVTVGALTDAERDERLHQARRVLLAHAREQSEALAEEAPERLFLRLLADGFASKRAYLEAKTGGEPADAGRWGWEAASSDGDAFGDPAWRHLPAAHLVGALDDEWVVLYPDAVYQYVGDAARRGGRVFPVELNTLIRRLDEAGLIATEVEGGHRRRRVNAWVGGATRRVIKLHRAALDVPPPVENREDREDREDDDPFSEVAQPTQIFLLPDLPGLPSSSRKEHGGDVDGEEIMEWSA